MSECIVKFHHDERGIVKTWDELGELIRCKDCKFNDGYCTNEDLNSHVEPLGLDGGALFETRPDFFCAYGKGKEIRI